MRREKDEFRITELKNEMTRLDGELTVEIKRRTEMNKSTQIVRSIIHYYHHVQITHNNFYRPMQWFEDQLTNLNKDFQETITARKAATDIRLDQLHQRITDLNTYFEEQKAAILKYVDDRGEELTRLLNKFKVCLTAFLCSGHNYYFIWVVLGRV